MSAATILLTVPNDLAGWMRAKAVHLEILAGVRWMPAAEANDMEGEEMTECTCTITDERYWFYYGSAVEPGSQMEPDPDCPKHFPEGAKK